MIALDTNILARFLTQDHPVQGPAARRAMERGGIYIPITVVVELEWVLRAGYRWSRVEVAAAIEDLLVMRGVVVAEAAAVRFACAAHRDGSDFTDMLHLALAKGCAELLTFDRKFAASTPRGETRPSLLT